MTVVEAMAAARPVVVTRTCPWAEVEDRQAGLWVAQEPLAIADGLRALADDRNRRLAMGRAGAALAAERYSWDALAGIMARHYESLVTPDARRGVA